jgi:hypothetical protein
LAKQNVELENIVARNAVGLNTVDLKDRVTVEKVDEQNEEVNVEDEADLLCLP